MVVSTASSSSMFLCRRLILIVTWILSILNHDIFEAWASSSSSDVDVPPTGQGVEIEIDETTGARYILNTDPSNGRLISKVKVTTPEELNDTIAWLIGKQRTTEWSRLPVRARVARIRAAFAAAFGDDDVRERLARLVATETGKVITDARDEVLSAVSWLVGAPLDAAAKANEDVEIDVGDGDGDSDGRVVAARVTREPLGVVAVIAPWNYPLYTPATHVVAALVAGNAVLVKPSESSPASTGDGLVGALTRADPSLPLAVVQGDGPTVGRRIVEHPDVDAIALTGSARTGRTVMATASRTLKRLIMELGGKDPTVVLADADLESAARDVVRASTLNAGQVCSSTERVYVDARIKDAFERLCVAEAAKLRVGPPREETSDVGPLVSRTQRRRVAAQVDDAVARGARVLFRSDAPNDGDAVGGNYYPVTVVADVPRDADLFVEETFGPVVAIRALDLGVGDDEEDAAAAAANDSPYGLTASVYTSDAVKGARIASRVRAGQVAVNAWPTDAAPLGCPWVGHKDSGHGYGDGEDGYRQYSLPKSVIVAGGAVSKNNDVDRIIDDDGNKEYRDGVCQSEADEPECN